MFVQILTAKCICCEYRIGRKAAYFLLYRAALHKVIERPQHSGIISVLCECDPCAGTNARDQVLFQGVFHQGPQIFFLGHDSSAQDHCLRIDHIADVRNSLAKDIGHFLDCTDAEPVALFGLFKDAVTVPDLCRFIFPFGNFFRRFSEWVYGL